MRAVDSDAELLARLRVGDEAAFASLVSRYHESMVRVARSFVPSRAVAEEAVQDTWLGVVRGLERFEGRSAFKTWLYRILVNRARSAGQRERWDVAADETRPAVDPARFDDGGAWLDPPDRWVDDADDRLAAQQLAGRLAGALDELPPRQRQVVLLRDVEGLSCEEACAILGISGANQRVLLHRGRSRLRELLEPPRGEGRPCN